MITKIENNKVKTFNIVDAIMHNTICINNYLLFVYLQWSTTRKFFSKFHFEIYDFISFCV